MKKIISLTATIALSASYAFAQGAPVASAGKVTIQADPREVSAEVTTQMGVEQLEIIKDQVLIRAQANEIERLQTALDAATAKPKK